MVESFSKMEAAVKESDIKKFIFKILFLVDLYLF